MSWDHASAAQRLMVGAGSLGRLGAVVREIGLQSVLLMTSPGRAASPVVDRVRGALRRVTVHEFTGAAPTVPAPVVQEAGMLVRREGVDAVVSVGGGSCADLAKAICFLAEQEAGTPAVSLLDRPGLVHVAVPTTYTPACVTARFFVSDPRSGRQTGGQGVSLAPVVVCADPDQTSGLDAARSAETGVAALAIAAEAVAAPSVEASVLAADAVRRLAGVLPLLVDDLDDVAVRGSALEGSVLAGRAAAQAPVGPVMVLAPLVAHRAGIPYGRAAAALLPAVLASADRRVGDALADPDDPSGAARALFERLGLPTGLVEAGVGPDVTEAVARMAATHPARVLDEDAAAAILDAAS